METKVKYNEANIIDKIYYVSRLIVLISVPIIIISALLLSLPYSHATSSVSGNTSSLDSISLTLSTSCTVSSSVLSPHNASINGGQHENEIGTTKVGVFCNDNNGYSIYAIGSGSDVDGNTDLVFNNGINDNYNIHTGIYNESSVTVSTPSSWSMKLTSGTGTGIDPDTGGPITTTPPTIRNNYNDYNIVPNNYTLVASRSSGTNMTIDTDITGSYFTTTYDIYATSVQPAGTYVGKVKYLIVHPAANTTNVVNDINLAFAMNNKQIAYQDADGSYYAMQDMTTEICNSITRTGEITATKLVDTRDNKLYWIAKLKDGNCWMTQNLDLDLETTPTNVAALTSKNTDLNLYGSMGYDSINGYSCSNDSNNCETGIITWAPERDTIAPNDLSSSTWINSVIYPYSYDRGLVAPNGVMGGHGYVGNYYNWTAAIASNKSLDYPSSTSNTASNSICPRGWRLPDNETYELSKLFYAYGVTNDDINGSGYANDGYTKLINSPLYFTQKAQRINSGSINGDNGYWTGTACYNSSHAHYIQYNNTGIYFHGNTGNSNFARHFGFPVRCLAR